VNLEELDDYVTLWGYKTDRDFSTLYAETSPQDYIHVRKQGQQFVVDVHGSPTTLLRDICSFFHTAGIPANFLSKSPPTAKRFYGKPK